LKILYILDVFPNLSESFIVNEIVELLKSGVDIEIFSYLRPKNEPTHVELNQYGLPQRVHYYTKNYAMDYTRALSCLSRKPVPFLKTLSYPFSFKEKIYLFPFITRIDNELEKTFKADLIHAHFATRPTTIAMSIAKIANVPFSFTAHAYDIFTNSNTALIKREIREAGGVVTISNYNKNYMIKLGADPDKVRVVHCGVNVEKFKPRRDGKAKRDSLVILTVARLVEKKGIEFLLRAAGQMLQEMEKPSIILKIVGSGPEEIKLRGLAKELGILKQVEFLGDVTDEELTDLYNSSEIFALPCIVAQNKDRDGIPVALMEAMSMELPVISTHVSGIPELVTNGKEGYLVPQKDIKSIAKAINNLIINPDLRRKMGVNARKKIEREFNIKNTCKDLLNFFEEVA
jgi:glycosyltransferase involved in cell wall biosynthesis